MKYRICNVIQCFPYKKVIAHRNIFNVFSKCPLSKHSNQHITSNTFPHIDQHAGQITRKNIAANRTKTHRDCQPKTKEYETLTIKGTDFQLKDKVDLSTVKNIAIKA